MEPMTPMMKQYFEIKSNYKDYILLYRLGDFYEMFYDDAVEASQILEITLTKRNAGNNRTAPLCGVPYHSVENYIAKLIRSGRKVAICEQTEDPALAKGIVKREVVRIITPGTLVDPQMLNEKENNYLCAITQGDTFFSICYCDITSGDVHINHIDRNEVSQLVDELNKLHCSELLVHQEGVNTLLLEQTALRDMMRTQLPATYFAVETCRERILKTFGAHHIDALGIENVSDIQTLGALLAYIFETQKVELTHFNQIVWDHQQQHMLLDKYTRSNLELLETLRHKEKRGSLLGVLDQSTTSMGARLLKQWIENPLLDLAEIQKRLDAVESLLEEKILREELKLALKGIYDLERLNSKLVFGTANARDLIALKDTLKCLPLIKRLLTELESIPILAALQASIGTFDTLADHLETALIDDPPFSIRDGGLFKDTYHDELYELRHIEREGKDWLLDIERQERENTGIKNLKVGFNKVFGYYLEVTKGNSKPVPDNYIRKQTLSNAERYITEPLKRYEEKLLGAEDRMHKLEHQLFMELIEDITAHVGTFKETAQALAKLDVLIAFATVSERQHYVKPTFNTEGAMAITGGRHPVVETLGAAQGFIPNDAHLDLEENRLFIITGPNMAGKSTFLRQVALISLMGQLGCFVPADSANLCVLDRIFTRVGASDDLTQGQSTFMVEMSELAHILRYATNRSLIILDEIGRGTSTYDGLSIAWSVVEYLSTGSAMKPKTLFATHYHELTELEGRLKGVQNYYIAVEEIKEDILFLRKIKKGGANKSFGIQVAKLAGLPGPVIQRAKEILMDLEVHDINRPSVSIAEDIRSDAAEPSQQQLSFFDDEASNILKELQTIDIDQMTPMYSMNKLYDLIQRAKGRKS